MSIYVEQPDHEKVHTTTAKGMRIYAQKI